MLLKFFPKIGDSHAVRLLRSFYRSYAYIAVIVLLMALSELCSFELPVFYCYLLLGGTGLLLADDAVPVLPIICCVYMTVSADNNPAAHPETSIFASTAFRVQFIVILSLAVVLLIARLVTSLIDCPKRKTPSLTIGFVLLGLGYILGGIFSEYYSFRTAFFGFVEVFSLCIVYFYFYYTIDWSKTDASYVLAVFVMLGFGMMCEVAGMYLLPNAVVDGSVNRHFMFTGWGTYNNVGCIMEMCIAAPFYFAIKRKNGWIFTMIGTVFLLVTEISQSRAAMLCGAIVYCACAVTVLVKTKGKERLFHIAVFAAVAVAAGIFVLVFREKFGDLFASILRQGIDDNGRLEIYRKCIEKFKESPVFGVGFYATPGHREWIEHLSNPFLPERAHNTVIQLLTSGGIFALACYLFHRAQTILLLFRRPSVAKTMIALSIAALLLTSMFDCHFFNFGPGLLYGALLVFAEGDDMNKANAPAACP